MAAVKKLVLLPATEWERILSEHSDIQIMPTREIVVSGQEQPLPPPCPPRESSPAPEAQTGKGAPPSPSPSLPATGAGEEGKVGETPPPKYVPREDTGKEQDSEQIRQDAGKWRPPGKPARRARRKWIHL